MRTLLILTLSIVVFSCVNKSAKNTTAIKSQKFTYEISFCILDTSDLDVSFWKINRQLEKLYPEHFKKPLDMSDTANTFYVTHLLKKHITTIGGRAFSSDQIPFFCVLKTDTSELRKFLSDTSYNDFFPANSSFAYGVETIQNNSCLDLFFISDTSVHFKNSDLEQVDLTYAPFGQPAIGVKLNEEAGRRLKSFTEMNLNRQIAILINGSVYCISKINAPLGKNYFEIVPKMTKEEISNLLEKAH
jgi:hypothetical protein